ncbi:MAG: hypothetical protein ACI9GW_003709, partial [Halieaceae bacterium]
DDLNLRGNNVHLLANIFTDFNQRTTTGTLSFFFTQRNDLAHAG